MKSKQELSRHQSGFTMIDMLLVLVIIAIISAFSIMGINRARTSLRLDSSARTMMAYLEKARLDAINRHARTSNFATLEVINSTSYRVTMDFGGNGVLTSQVVALESGVSIIIPTETVGTTVTPVPPVVTFDWRGVNEGGENIVLTNGSAQTTVNATEWGDVTLNDNLTIPVPTTVPDIAPTLSIHGDTVLNVSSTGCVLTTNPTSLSLGKNKSATVRTSISSATGINTVYAATTSILLTVSPTSQDVTGNGTVAFTVKSGKKTGSFAVTFSSPCGSKNVAVTIG
jgi:prepilin-type N-terminal cleavage/methylation domain-containing protein